MRKYDEIELLSPAGSYEGLEAVIGAGADAVYVGGPAFGARAYAKNFEEEELLRAIDMVHMHGRKLYLTVNTLLKNREVEEQLYHYLLPYYKEGLDAVLVQDLGVLRFLRRNFPGLPLHASTQMTITGPDGMRFLEKEGVTRVVGARELSLNELRTMHASSPLEIEAFVHGALCYSYSGQCLMSSIFGGRSGNRGRCAQPCRLAYQCASGKGDFRGKKDLCPLSLKDLCTIDLLPEILDAGVMSLKIEGRMKQPQYAAGVTQIYRKYLDRILEKGAETYCVEESDRRFLMELFNRGSFCDGYFKQHNGPSMMAFSNEKKTGSPDVSLRSRRAKIWGCLYLMPGMPASLSVGMGETTVTVSSTEEVQAAVNQPMQETRIRQQMEKLGNTLFEWEQLEIVIEGDVFVPVKTLNSLRRDALEELRKTCLLPFYREDPPASEEDALVRKAEGHSRTKPRFYVSCETWAQAQAAAKHKEIRGLYLPYSVMEICMGQGMAAELELYLALPHMVRGETPQGYFEQAEQWIRQGMKGFLVRNLESFARLEALGYADRCVLDSSVYTWNQEAIAFFREKGVLRNTAPLELNEKELRHRDNCDSELLVYGYLPLMVSAQCVRKNMFGCDRREGSAQLRDRYDAVFESVCYCDPWKMKNTKGPRSCYNMIYNSLPYALIKDQDAAESLGFDAFRLSFTTEDAQKTDAVIQEFLDSWIFGRDFPEWEFTRGHFKRGVE